MEPGTSSEAAGTPNPEQSPAQKLHFFVCSNFVIPLQSRTGHCQKCLLTFNQEVTTQNQYYCFLV